VITFRTGPEDARALSRHFEDIDEADFQNLPNYELYARMMIDGEPSRAFSGKVMTPDQLLNMAS
jgi:hypothetical protein